MDRVERTSHAEVSFASDEIVKFELPLVVTMVPGVPFDLFGVLHPIDKDDFLNVDEHVRSILCIKGTFCPLPSVPRELSLSAEAR